MENNTENNTDDNIEISHLLYKYNMLIEYYPKLVEPLSPNFNIKSITHDSNLRDELEFKYTLNLNRIIKYNNDENSKLNLISSYIFLKLISEKLAIKNTNNHYNDIDIEKLKKKNLSELEDFVKNFYENIIQTFPSLSNMFEEIKLLMQTKESFTYKDVVNIMIRYNPDNIFGDSSIENIENIELRNSLKLISICNIL
jgi:hypothetical protein